MKDGNKKIELLKDARYVGIDLAKKIFGVVVTDCNRKVLQKKMVKVSDFQTFLETLPKNVTLFMEGCGTSQFWARELLEKGFDPRIVPAQYVSPYVQMGKKNDLNDAMAVIEAGLKDGINFIPVKTPLQRELAGVVSRRSQLVEDKVRLQNQIHAIYREAGQALNEKKTSVTFIKEAYLGLDSLKIASRLKLIIKEMLEELKSYSEKIEEVSTLITSILEESKLENNETSRAVNRMLSVYGVGPITVATMTAHAGSLKQFKSGRQLSAFLGLTPRQFSSGGKNKLGSISKSGNATLRGLLVLCAQSFLIRINRLDQESPLVKWLQKKLLSMNKKKLIVALANKLARILWAVSVKDEDFKFA